MNSLTALIIISFVSYSYSDCPVRVIGKTKIYGFVSYFILNLNIGGIFIYVLLLFCKKKQKTADFKQAKKQRRLFVFLWCKRSFKRIYIDWSWRNKVIYNYNFVHYMLEFIISIWNNSGKIAQIIYFLCNKWWKRKEILWYLEKSKISIGECLIAAMVQYQSIG